MSQYGRRQVPGEKGPRDLINQQNVLNRTIRAQVTSVEPTQGYVILTYESLPGGGKYATVPPLWMSFPPSTSTNGPAWGRYMPQQTDLVKVSFDYDDRPYIMGYDIIASKDDIGGSHFGWPALNDQYEAAHGNPDVDPDRAKFAQFVPLNEGEYDFMSSGGAYIYGNNRGRLYLAGGSVSVSLIKNDLRISSRSQLWSHIADNCDFRFGQVRRTDPSTQLDTTVATDASGTYKEFMIDVQTTVAPGTSTRLGLMQVGNVTDPSAGTVTTSSATGSPLRYNYVNYSDAGISNLTSAIDNLGNWEVIAPTAPNGVKFDFSLGEWQTSFTTINHIASSSCTLTSPTVTYNASSSFTVNSPNISLGGVPAIHPLLLTNIYRPAEDVFLSAIVSSISLLGAAVAAIGATFTAVSVPSVTVFNEAQPIFAAAGTATSAAGAAAIIPATTGLSTWSAASQGFLSRIVKNA